MKKALSIGLLALLLQQPSPSQLITQIEDALKQLKAQVVPPQQAASTKVTTTAELQAALKACNPSIELAPGDYTANWVTTCSNLTITGPREAVLKAGDQYGPTLWIKSGTGIKVKGFSVAAPALVDRDTINIGDSDATTVAALPKDVWVEDLLLDTTVTGGHRAIAAHGVNVTIVGNTILGYWEKGRHSQAIVGWNGPGPYLIENNVLEASGENIMFGGSDPKIPGLVPSDIVIRNNILRKPDYMKTNGAAVYNAFELKNAQRVLFEGNTIDGWWPGGHAGPMQITVRNQSGGCGWCIVDAVTLTRNTYSRVQGGIAVNVLGTDNERDSNTGLRKFSQQTKKLTISYNLFAGSTTAYQILGGVSESLVIDHNTTPHVTAKVFSFDRVADTPDVLTPLTFTNNVTLPGSYGATGNGTTIGLPTLQAFTTIAAWSGNIIEAEPYVTWPAGQTVIPKGSLLGLLDPKTFKLLSGTAGY